VGATKSWLRRTKPVTSQAVCTLTVVGRTQHVLIAGITSTGFSVATLTTFVEEFGWASQVLRDRGAAQNEPVTPSVRMVRCRVRGDRVQPRVL
jgi:hypothetical protein